MGIGNDVFDRKRIYLSEPINKIFRKRFGKFYVWSVALYGSETLSDRMRLRHCQKNR